MNNNNINEKFNAFYEKLNQEHYLEIKKLQEEEKKETTTRRLMWVLYAIFFPFSFYITSVLMGIIDDIPYEQHKVLVLILFCIVILLEVAVIIGIPTLIYIHFTKKSDNLQKTYKLVLYNSLFDSINNKWEFCYPIKKQGMMDYWSAKFPKEYGNADVIYAIKSKEKVNTLEAIFFDIWEGNSDGPGSSNYIGLYFSILNNNNISDNIYIRSKEYDRPFHKVKLPFSKLNIDIQNYNIYAKDFDSIPNGLIELMNSFYELTNLNCDLTITKDKIQVRFDAGIIWSIPKKEIFNRNKIERIYYLMFQINNFINELCSLLSNQR